MHPSPQLYFESLCQGVFDDFGEGKLALIFLTVFIVHVPIACCKADGMAIYISITFIRDVHQIHLQ